MSGYNGIVIDHYQHPRNAGALDGADAVGAAQNAACGDSMRLYVRLRGDRVEQATFEALGCTAAIAAGSVLTELISGRGVEELRQLGRGDVEASLGGLPKMKSHAAVLAEAALRAALNQLDPTAAQRDI